MKTLENVATAATSVLGYLRTGGPACPRFTAPPVLTGRGTGLPIGESAGDHKAARILGTTRLPLAVTGTRLRAFGSSGVMGADQVERASVAIPVVSVDPWDPPRRTPPRC